MGLEGDLRGCVDPSGSNFLLRSPSVLTLLHRILTYRVTRKEGKEEGRRAKWAAVEVAAGGQT